MLFMSKLWTAKKGCKTLLIAISVQIELSSHHAFNHITAQLLLNYAFNELNMFTSLFNTSVVCTNIECDDDTKIRHLTSSVLHNFIHIPTESTRLHND